ncbi:hypothetical protein SASPL_123949 [Salvia splendens]|uniref:Uncharacterized protein n=1 Tax=Salvia splendens TaxID=180675 RepID=A0A8X8ZTP2_SALSN|nr:hypothetical protein SASPL_123949 [Salvia splendens]
MAACNRIHKKLDEIDEQHHAYHEQSSDWPVASAVPQPPYGHQPLVDAGFHPPHTQPPDPPDWQQPYQPYNWGATDQTFWNPRPQQQPNPDPPDWHCHSPTNNQPTYTAPPYDQSSLVDAGFHPPLTKPPDRRMEVFVEMESHLAVTDRRVDSLHPPNFPGPEPPNAHSDWQQPTSGLLSGFNLPPQGQPIYPMVVSPPPPRALMIPPCSHEDQRVSSCEVISPPRRQRSPTAPLPAADAPLQGGEGNIQGLEIGEEESNLT